PHPPRGREHERVERGSSAGCFLEEHQPLSRLTFWRLTVWRCRNSAMMIARPTAASAAATVMTKKTNTCPVTPYACANATNVRFTALSINSTHMKTMIALRRMSTPTTPITNNTAEKNRASASIAASRGFAPLLAEHHGPHDSGEEQNTRHLEREQIILE